ncbi:MAG: bile acid:sodium symporter family protein [Bacteroidales bacterium]|nr:bile acid:sodium symporter family protein [Bacteroidales bacterium]MDZ4203209.1 bile acid:sodium symporter family protein [Bacteroidales bacterium]
MNSELINKIADKATNGGGLINSLEQVLLLLMVLVIMFGMGATLNFKNFRDALKKPKGILVGFLSQFGIMPIVAYSIAVILKLDPQNAIALILIGCLPAGSTSNMFTYFSRGDVALSISMTTASTLTAIIMTPILLGIYASGFAEQIIVDASGQPFKIPYINIIISLALVLIPVIGGMILLKKSPDWAKVAEEIASFTGIVIIIFLLVSVIARHGDLMLLTPWTIFVSALFVGLFGMLFGYFFSWGIKLPPRWRRTISLETGIQNGPLSFAIVLASFKAPMDSQLLWLPILYSAMIVASSSIVTLFFRKIGKNDWELYENQTIQEKLFGKVYASKMANQY